MIRSVDFLPRFLFEHLHDAGEEPSPCSSVISIGDPGQEPPWCLHEYSEFLRVEFLDLEPDICERHKISPDKLFNEYQAREIVSFVRAMHNHDRPVDLIVHCEAGVSRSAAVALYAAAIAGLDLPEHRDASGANLWVLAALQKADRDVGQIEIPRSRRLASDGGVLSLW